MMRWLGILTALIGIVLLFGCLGFNNGKLTPGIFGQVISKGTRQPIANATVSLRRDGNELASVQTNGDGRFAFPNLEPGTYLLVVSANGYWDAQVWVTLAQGQRLTISVEMLLLPEGPPTDVPITD